MTSAALHGFVDTLDRKIEGMHSVMVLRHGKVIAEGWWAPYAAEHNHVLYSLSKSFTSTAVGLAVAEGKLDVRDPVLKFFPDDGPAEPNENLRAMRVRDLLTMSTGQPDEPPRSPDTVSAASFLSQPVADPPGTRFRYNTPATFMQSAIVQKVTGQTVLDYLKPRLFAPLGIEQPAWDTNFEGISLGGYGLRVRTEDIAKLGQLYLQKGKWNGRQLLPAEWVAQTTSRQIPNGDNQDSDWNQGYGFQFWMCRHGAYRGDGAFGQYCVVMPEQHIVVAITSGVTNMQAVLNVIWEHVLPAVEHKAAVADPEGVAKLRAMLAGLEMPPARGRATSPMADAIFGRRYPFPDNDRGIESLSIIPSDDGKTVALALTRGGRESRIPCGYLTWEKGQAPFDAGPLAKFPDEPVAGTFAWKADDTLLFKICAYETPFAATLKLKFTGDRMTLDAQANVAFGPTKHPQLTGTLESVAPRKTP